MKHEIRTQSWTLILAAAVLVAAAWVAETPPIMWMIFGLVAIAALDVLLNIIASAHLALVAVLLWNNKLEDTDWSRWINAYRPTEREDPDVEE